MSLLALETKWKTALTSILEELTPPEVRKLLFKLHDIPQGRKTKRHREELPDLIIKHYGTEGSISVIDKEMKVLPRNDARVQELLRPFVEEVKELKKQRQEAKEKKRKRDDEEEEGSVLKHVTPNQFDIQNQQKSSQADNERSATATWKKSIRDLKSSEILETEGFNGKVVQKSGLRPYQNKENASVQKCFFNLGVADETASVKVKVYGKDRYKELEEGKSYLFCRGLSKKENFVVVNSNSKVAQVNDVAVPEELEQEATKLIYPPSPAFSIQEAKSLADKTRVRVEGTVTEIDPFRKGKVKYKATKVKQQRFQLKDDTGSIRIVMWDEAAVGLCVGLSVGDFVLLSGMKTNVYCGDVSLNSTVDTTLIKRQSVGVQKLRIEIIGIKKATKKETQLEAEVQQQLHTYVVATQLLLKAFGLKLAGDFRERLLEVMPLAADAEIRGNKITAITAASKM